MEFEKVKSLLLITCQIQLIAYVRSYVSEEFQLLKGKVFYGVLKKILFTFLFPFFFPQNEPNKRIKNLTIILKDYEKDVKISKLQTRD